MTILELAHLWVFMVLAYITLIAWKKRLKITELLLFFTVVVAFTLVIYWVSEKWELLNTPLW